MRKVGTTLSKEWRTICHDASYLTGLGMYGSCINDGSYVLIEV